ncbi:response regulator [Flavihumibacter solisilvae]|uniref:LuxR family transcriptional regulator n=1 Tax=Flavihumibacter solisilvae TaxID=1349421 RepID=A0A0C1IN62_9BACT|nr:response regulator [Flavihumibacter solisilvae]KIC95680.1 hypothetical protein OI18_05420 [Flavihumibacter solisilvae]
MKSILLADDHGIVRSGIRLLLTDHFRFGRIDEASAEEEIAQCVKRWNYDLMMLDINMPNTDFPGLMHWLQAAAPAMRVIVFTMHSEQLFGVHALKLGAYGFLNKNASNEEIVTAIRNVLENRKYISPTLAQLIAENETGGRDLNPFSNLSPRELEIAMLLDKGHSLPEVCHLLNIQYSTGNTYKRRIFEKMGVTSILALTRLFQQYNQ